MRIILAALLAAFLLPTIANAERASFYGGKFHGKRTASGRIYDQNAYTCAHRTAAFGTRFRVTYKGRSTFCTVTDRGPFTKKNGRFDRDIDLSVAGARDLEMISVGVATVTISKE